MNKAPLFDGISVDELNRMFSCFNAKELFFSPGQVVRSLNPRGDIGVIRYGLASIERIEVSGSRSILEDLKPGDAFGDALGFSSIDDGSVSVVAKTELSVLYISYSCLTKVCTNACTHHNTLIHNMLRIISEKSARLSERVQILACRSIRDKLLTFFNIYAGKHGLVYTLPFSMGDLADYICADRSAMLRELSNMRKDGIIQTVGRTIDLRNTPLSDAIFYAPSNMGYTHLGRND